MRSSSPLIFAALALLAVFVAALAALPKGVFLTPDEGAKYLMLHSMEVSFDGLAYHLPYGGQEIDPEHRFFPHRHDGSGSRTFPYPLPQADGTLLFHWPIWFSLLSGVLYAPLGLIGIYLLPWACGWLIAVLSGWLAERVHPGMGSPAVVLTGLGTPVLFYSLSFWEHTTAALLGLAAVTAWAIRPGPRSYLVACVLIVIAAFFRIDVVVLGMALVLTAGVDGIWTITHHPATTAAGADNGWFRIGVAALLMILAVCIALLMFPFLPPRMHGFIERIPELLASLPTKLEYLPRGLISVLINEASNEGPAIEVHWAAAALAGVALCFVAPFLPRAYLEGPVLLSGLAVVVAFSASLLASGSYRSVHGVFPIAPYGVMATYALLFAWRSGSRVLLRLAVLTLVYLVLGVAALFISFVNPPGMMITGLEWGQRYLLPLYPLLAVLALVAASDYWRSQRPLLLRLGALSLIATTMILGLLFEVRGLRMLRTNLQVFSRWDQVLRQGDPVVTDVWWLPAALADLLVTHEVFYVTDRERLEEWGNLAQARGIRRFRWLAAGAPGADGIAQVAQYRRVRGVTSGDVFFELPQGSVSGE